MHKKMNQLNSLSAISFAISSLSLLIIPFINTGDGLPKVAYATAAIFWIGLLIGVIIQIYLAHKCKKMELHNKLKEHRIPLAMAVFSFLFLLLLIILRSQSKIAVIICLFATIVSLQFTVIIKRKGCLK